MTDLRPHEISSAKWLSEHMQYQQAKALRERDVEDSILEMRELQKATNDFLETAQKLQDTHIVTSKNQVVLIGALVEEQKSIRIEQAAAALAAKKSADIQFWINVFVAVITTLGFILMVMQFYETKR